MNWYWEFNLYVGAIRFIVRLMPVSWRYKYGTHGLMERYYELGEIHDRGGIFAFDKFGQESCIGCNGKSKCCAPMTQLGWPAHTQTGTNSNVITDFTVWNIGEGATR